MYLKKLNKAIYSKACCLFNINFLHGINGYAKNKIYRFIC